MNLHLPATDLAHVSPESLCVCARARATLCLEALFVFFLNRARACVCACASLSCTDSPTRVLPFFHLPVFPMPDFFVYYRGISQSYYTERVLRTSHSSKKIKKS